MRKLSRPTIGDSLLNMGSRWTLVLCRGLSKPSSQESRSGSYGSVKDVFAAPVGLMAALMLSSVTAGAWAFVLLFLWDGLGIVLRFFFRSQRG